MTTPDAMGAQGTGRRKARRKTPVPLDTWSTPGFLAGTPRVREIAQLRTRVKELSALPGCPPVFAWKAIERQYVPKLRRAVSIYLGMPVPRDAALRTRWGMFARTPFAEAEAQGVREECARLRLECGQEWRAARGARGDSGRGVQAEITLLGAWRIIVRYLGAAAEGRSA